MSRAIEAINRAFLNRAKTIIRFRWPILLICTGLCIVAGSGISRLKLEDDPKSWLLEDDPLHRAQKNFETHFGNNDYVIVLVKTQNVFSHKALSQIRKLGNDLMQKVPFAEKVVSLAHLEFTKNTEEGLRIEELVPEPVPVSKAELLTIKKLALSKPHLVDRLFSRDATHASIILRLKPFPTDQEKKPSEYQIMINRAVDGVLAKPAYRGLELLDAGMPIMVAEKTAWTNRESVRLFILSLMIMLALLTITQRSVLGVVAPMLTVLMAIVIVFGIMGWLNIPIQAMVAVIPILLALVISIGYSIHIFSSFQQHFRISGDRHEAIAKALEHTGWPILFTALTTVVGFLAFTGVSIKPLRWIGWTCGSLILLVYPMVILITPALLSFGRSKNVRDIRKAPLQTASRADLWFERALVRFGDWVRHHGKLVVSVFSIIILFFSFFISRLEIDTDNLRLMGLKVPYVKKMYEVADSVGSLYSFDLILNFDRKDHVKDPSFLKKLEQLTKEIEHSKLVKRTSSILDIIKDLNQTVHDNDPKYRYIPKGRQQIAQLLLLYEMSGGSESKTWVNYSYSISRVKVELKHYSSRGAKKLLDNIRARSAHLFPGARLDLSGVVVQYTGMIIHLIRGQIQSIIIAIIGIAFIMMFVFGSIKLGLIGMIPNTVPVLVTVGAMGLFGTPLHNITMIIAPIVIGLAVDDTIHYINHFKLAYWKTADFAETTRDTFRTVGRAITMTTTILVLGFLPFTTSIAKVYVQLGWYTILAMVTALAADYLITPNLLIWASAVQSKTKKAKHDISVQEPTIVQK